MTQGNRSFAMTPLSNGQTIERFYDFGDFEINSPLPIAKSDTSRLFFWAGPKGLSLVTIHDKADDGTGGAASLDLAGLPTSVGEWVVRDDDTGNDDYSDDGTDPDWKWSGRRTDGGAYRGGLTGETITITPAFNEAADKNIYDPGRIRRWEFVTGQATDPRNVSMDLDEPITVEVPEALANGSTTDEATTGSMEWTYDVPSSVGDRGLDLTYQTEQTGMDPNATVVVSGYEQAADPRNRRQVTERYDLTLGTVGTVRQYVPLDTFQPGTEVTVRAVSANVSTRLQVTTRTDTDGDGLWNGWENKTYTYEHLPATDSGRTTGRIQPTQTFNTSWQDPDTDDDGVLDSQEYSVQRLPANETRETARLVANSTTHPTDPDTDGDGALDDEFRGWNITIVETASGDPFRYYNRSKSDPPENGRTIDTIHVSSEPLDRDTDGDGLVDGVEKATTFTDPRAEVTYELTEQHQDLIEDLEADGRAGVAIGAHIVDDREQLSSLELTDRTDDFDFVRPTFGQDLARVDFHALDSVVRTDTWLSNEEEVDKSVVFNGSVNPWDPDSDDDGLTDGQEVHGLTKAVSADLVEMDDSVSYESDPTNSDTDGDGYWDGWIGVYGVGWSDNVVLYQEHLSTGDGIEGEEVVPEQIGTHHVSSPVPGADVDSDGKREHSNIHLGESYWNGKAGHSADPRDAGSEPDLDLAVEVDRYENASKLPIRLLDNVSRNYALYGLNVTFTESDIISKKQLENRLVSRPHDPNDGRPKFVELPIGYQESLEIEQTYHNDTSKFYMFVTTEGDQNPGDLPQSFNGTGGVAPTNGNNFPSGFGWGVLIFTQDHDGTEPPNHTKSEHLHKTIMHEIGHVMGAGRKDDGALLNPFAEVYSGSDSSPRDPTKEYVGTSPYDDPRWSIMSSSWVDEATGPPMDGRYFAFSIEKLLTIELKNIDTVNSNG